MGLRSVFSRPPGYRNVFVWFVTGMLRDLRGLAGALVASWFHLPSAIFLGGVGLVAGGIVGFVGGLGVGSDVLPSWVEDWAIAWG